jgi:hypothetical protein
MGATWCCSGWAPVGSQVLVKVVYANISLWSRMPGHSYQTHTAGAGVAFDTVERLILRACSCTLDLASSIELPLDRVDLHRAMVAFGAAGTRMDLEAGNAILGESEGIAEGEDLGRWRS